MKMKQITVILVVLLFCLALNVSCNGGQQKDKPASVETLNRAKTTAVRAKFAQDKELAGANVKVSVFNLECVLEGEVSSEDTKKRAEELALSVDGVEKVDNRLKVKKTE